MTYNELREGPFKVWSTSSPPNLEPRHPNPPPPYLTPLIQMNSPDDRWSDRVPVTKSTTEPQSRNNAVLVFEDSGRKRKNWLYRLRLQRSTIYKNSHKLQ